MTDADAFPKSRGMKFMEIRYIVKREGMADNTFEWLFTEHKSLDVDWDAGHKYRHLELNMHPGSDLALRSLWMRLVSSHMGLTQQETDLAAQITDNMPFGSGFRVAADGEWAAYNLATGDELDLLELSAPPMHATARCERGLGER